MISFVNAKINIGLQIVRRRADGYHDLQTLFYPVGIHAGTPENPTAFCDVLEVIRRDKRGFGFHLDNDCGCAMEKNLVWRAAELYFREYASPDFGAEIWLEKHLPSGAGLGGGSVDAAFTLLALERLEREGRGEYGALADTACRRLAETALKLGADCPFFIYNRPMYAEGVGERLEDANLNLGGYSCVVVKPPVFVSTKEAFAGVVPRPGNCDLREAVKLPIEEWQGLIENDFERSLFPQHPELEAIKERLLGLGASYASMSGSGSSLYGIFKDKAVAETALQELQREATNGAVYLLKL